MDTEAVLNTVKTTLEREITVEKVYLFGSRAKGSYHTDSDYDLAIISPDFEDRSFSERQQLVRPLIREALGDVPLDVACYTPHEFEDGKTASLPAIIHDEGISA